MKASFILVLLLVAFSCGGKRKKKPSSGGGFNLKDFFSNRMRTPIPSTPKTTPKTTVKPTAKSSNLNTVNYKLQSFFSRIRHSFCLFDLNLTDGKSFGLSDHFYSKLRSVIRGLFAC